MASIVVSIEPTEGQAPWGARTYADRVDANKFVSTHTGPAPQECTYLGLDKITGLLKKKLSQRYFRLKSFTWTNSNPQLRVVWWYISSKL